MPIRRNKKMIGAGRTRAVYDLRSRYVLKTAKSEAGIRSNRTEANLYRSPRYSSVRKHLAKVLKHSRRFSWLIMQKYTRPFRITKSNMRKYRQLNRKFRKNGIWPRDIYSMTHKGPSLTNLRLNRRGTIIVIDYGNFRVLRSRKKG